MTMRFVVAVLVASLVAAAPAHAQKFALADAQAVAGQVQQAKLIGTGQGKGAGTGEGKASSESQAARDQARDDRSYQRGVRALDERKWDEAARIFAEVAATKGSRADGALYWRAYALNRLGQRAEAVAALTELRNGFSQSRWTSEARALDVEIRQSAGQRVGAEAEADDDLKLLALQGLTNRDPEQALPLLEKFLQGAQSPKLKDRALFVLAQSSSARAREILASIARGAANPDLQTRAIHYLGIHGGRENRQLLADVYAASNDVAVKRQILRSFMVSGERERLLNAARTEQSAELREEAVRQLGVMGAHEELWQLYGNETSREVKTRIIQAMFVGGNAERLIELAKTEQDPELRRTAVRNLGLIRSQRTGDALTGIYAADKDVEIRKAVIQALFVQNNARALVDLARKETDPAMKKEIVRKLSVMRAKEATDYLLEILK